MSSNVHNSFNILKLVELDMQLERRGSIAAQDIKAAPSNYYRNQQAPEDMRTQGREYIIRKSELDKTAFTSLRRGDALISTELGEKSIIEIREMIILGKIVGWRIRVDG
jgi:hypothetical protein